MVSAVHAQNGRRFDRGSCVPQWKREQLWGVDAANHILDDLWSRTEDPDSPPDQMELDVIGPYHYLLNEDQLDKMRRVRASIYARREEAEAEPVEPVPSLAKKMKVAASTEPSSSASSSKASKGAGTVAAKMDQVRSLFFVGKKTKK